MFDSERDATTCYQCKKIYQDQQKSDIHIPVSFIMYIDRGRQFTRANMLTITNAVLVKFQIPVIHTHVIKENRDNVLLS